jgi:hypothetical protein
MQVIGCRMQARRASRFGQNANQIDGKIDEIIDFAAFDLDHDLQRRASGVDF